MVDMHHCISLQVHEMWYIQMNPDMNSGLGMIMSGGFMNRCATPMGDVANS